MNFLKSLLGNARKQLKISTYLEIAYILALGMTCTKRKAKDTVCTSHNVFPILLHCILR